jgi:hypothetical protein
MSVARGGLPLAHVPAKHALGLKREARLRVRPEGGIRFTDKDMLQVARKNKPRTCCRSPAKTNMVNPGSSVNCFTKPGTLPCHFNPNFNPELYMAEFNDILTTMETARALA